MSYVTIWDSFRVVPCSRGIPGEAIIAAAGALEIPSTAALTVVGFGADIGLELLGRRLAVGGQVHGIDRSANMLAVKESGLRPTYSQRHALDLHACRACRNRAGDVHGAPSSQP